MTGDKDSFSRTILSVSIRTLVNAVLLFALVEGFISAYHFSYELFADYPCSAASHDTMQITINPGDSAKDVALVLEEFGIVSDKYVFLARAYLGKYNSRIQAGSYTLSPAMSPEEICKTICGVQSEETQ